MKILSYNVNGIRSAISKGLLDWLRDNPADIVCLQEVKAREEDVKLDEIIDMDYHVYWCAAVKKGYSGVAILSKVPATAVCVGMDQEMSDAEGRVIRIDIADITIINAYFPSGTTGDVRQQYKYEWLSQFQDYIQLIRHDRDKVVVCGDYNICHMPIDIHDPKGNKNSSGFLPDERAWMDEWFHSGMIDCFRYINPHPHQYTWWSYRANARANNKGWRIDYISITNPLIQQLVSATIHPDAVHSDHCPVSIVLDI